MATLFSQVALNKSVSCSLVGKLEVDWVVFNYFIQHYQYFHYLFTKFIQSEPRTPLGGRRKWRRRATSRDSGPRLASSNNRLALDRLRLDQHRNDLSSTQTKAAMTKHSIILSASFSTSSPIPPKQKQKIE